MSVGTDSRGGFARSLLLALVLAGLSGSVFADGIDISVWFTHVFTRTRDGLALALMLGLMLVNYGTNLLVVALPAVRAGPVTRKQALRDLVGLTLFGQASDRAGSVVAFLMSLPILYLEDELHLFPGDPADEIPGLTSLVVTLAVVGVICSGLVVGLLVFHYTYRRWRVERRSALRIAIGAGILTNPLLWALGAGLGIQSIA